MRHDWDSVMRAIAEHGGLTDAGGLQELRRVNPLVRQQRELAKARSVTATEIKTLNAEKQALETKAKEKTSEYTL